MAIKDKKCLSVIVSGETGDSSDGCIKSGSVDSQNPVNGLDWLKP